MPDSRPAGADRLPDRQPVLGRDVDLEPELAREAHSKQTHRDTADASLPDPQVRQCGGRKIDVRDERRQHVARLRSLQGDDGPLLRGRREPRPQVRPLGLQIVLHERQDARRPARRRRHVITIVRDARDHAVVVNEAVVAQQDAVAAATHREAREVVHVHARQERRGIGPHDLDLAERRGIEDAASRAHRATLAGDRPVHVFAGPREVASPLPLSHVLEHGTLPARPLVHRRRAHRIEQVAAVVAGECAERHGRVRHPERGQTDVTAAVARDRRPRSRARSCSTSCPGRSPCRPSCSA